MRLEVLNAATSEAAVRALMQCCGSARWAVAMAARRPFPNADQLYRASEDVWWSLEGSDWLEAFSHHPRIGGRAGGWANDEQSGMRDAAAPTSKALAQRNREYERKFGHVFLICATGKRPDEMLSSLEQRLTNQPAEELKIAAGEQAKITRLRLEKLLSPLFDLSSAE